SPRPSALRRGRRWANWRRPSKLRTVSRGGCVCRAPADRGAGGITPPAPRSGDRGGTLSNDATYDLVIHAERAVLPDGVDSARIGGRDGRIVEIAGGGAESNEGASARVDVIEVGPDEVLLPGLVDSHVHVNDPGRAEWEGFASATRAAAAGGVTTIVDMPLNSLPPTVDVAALDTKREVAGPKAFVDVG